MHDPDIGNLTMAAQLCQCNGEFCDSRCVVCFSPKWQAYACIKQLWQEHIRKHAPNDAPGPDGFVCGFHCDQWAVSDHCPIHRHDMTPEQAMERAIDWLEDNGIVLEPWQATAFRAIMLDQRVVHNGNVMLIPPGWYALPPIRQQP